MEELGVPKKLQDDRMGHTDGSVQARYSHITAVMRQRLMDDLTEQWEAALKARKSMAPGSPIWALDRLLRAEQLDSVIGPLPVGRTFRDRGLVAAIPRSRNRLNQSSATLA